MSRKSELISGMKSYQARQEEFKEKITAISRSLDFTPVGAAQRIEELSKPFEEVAIKSHDKVISIIDNGIKALEDKWRANSAGRLKDSAYQIGLANAIKMIEAGAITDKEDFKNIIEVYKDDYNALSTIRNILGTDTNEIELKMMIPNDSRAYNKKLLNDLRKNVDGYINPLVVKDSISMIMDSLLQFVEDRLNDDLEVIV
jgi:hypothetical protein